MTPSRRKLIPVLAALVLASLACTCGALGRKTPTPTPPVLQVAPTEETSLQPTAEATSETVQPTDTEASQAQATEAPATKPPIGGGAGGGNASSPFPVPDDAKNVIQAGGSTIYQTSKSLKDMIAFYKDAFTQKGYTERTALHVEAAGTFSIVFDGDPSGQATVVQGVDLGAGGTNISIRLEAIP
jgi:hypothetical protein